MLIIYSFKIPTNDIKLSRLFYVVDIIFTLTNYIKHSTIISDYKKGSSPMKETQLLTSLLPAHPDILPILKEIREKHNIPEIDPEVGDKNEDHNSE